MGLIVDRYPALSMPKLRQVAGIVATERNAVVEVNKLWKGCTWGLGCLCCQAVLRKLESIAQTSGFEWLGFKREIGMAYTITVDGIPLRIQPDIEEIREVMPNEREALERLRPRPVAGLLFDLPPIASEILRLETTQTAGRPVSMVTLYLFDEHSGRTLDSELLYSPNAADDFRRPARDANTADVFEFPPANDQAEDGQL